MVAGRGLMGRLALGTRSRLGGAAQKYVGDYFEGVGSVVHVRYVDFAGNLIFRACAGMMMRCVLGVEFAVSLMDVDRVAGRSARGGGVKRREDEEVAPKPNKNRGQLASWTSWSEEDRARVRPGAPGPVRGDSAFGRCDGPGRGD